MRPYISRWVRFRRAKDGGGSLALIGLSLALALAGGCGGAVGNPSEAGTASPARSSGRAPYRIVTTVGMISDIVSQVAGDRAEVEGLIGEGIDPHLYKPTRFDVVRLSQADVVFYNGLLLEGKMGDVLVRVARQGKPVHAVAEAIQDQGGYVLLKDDRHADPHVWMDVSGWMKAVEVVASALAEYDPEHAAAYRANAQAYLLELDRLDAYAQQAIDSIPADQRVLITAHDAFNYLGRAYGLEVRGIQGLSTESEAGVQDIERLIRFLVDRRIPAVFVETSVADKNVRALVEGARARGHPVQIGGALFSDAMGPAGTYEGTYIGMLDHNVTVIARGLGGQAPDQGMKGTLSHAH